jgi:hypothetical protein
VRCEEVADRRGRVLGVGAIEHSYLARVDVQEQFLEITLAQVGRTIDVEIIPHQVKENPQLIGIRPGIAGQPALRRPGPPPEAGQRRIERVLRHGR